MNSTTQELLRHPIDQSFVNGFRVVVLLCAGLAQASSLAAGLLIEGKWKARSSEESYRSQQASNAVV